jgi:Beta-glucan synthesis-associated protein (SKN1).
MLQWPYTYDACDVGTAPNQTHNGFPLPATINGDPSANYALSFLPGQRLSRCTCHGESHPGPTHSDGTYVGRSAPEIDMFEAQVNEISFVLPGCSYVDCLIFVGYRTSVDRPSVSVSAVGGMSIPYMVV